jgi:hypothetical protein
MTAMNGWWQELTPVNQGFYIAAAFLGVFFVWQLISTLVGLGGHDMDVDTHVGADAVHHTPPDAESTMAAFKLVSLRSILAFFTLFTWGGALYMNCRVPVGRAIVYGVAWGLAGMFAVSLIIHFMRRMAETGNLKLESCVGQSGSVYLNIPAGGVGEVRAHCGGVMTHLKARGRNDAAIPAGTPVRVVRMLEPNVIEVEPEIAERKESRK